MKLISFVCLKLCNWEIKWKLQIYKADLLCGTEINAGFVLILFKFIENYGLLREVSIFEHFF